jgi:hypothetical protein
MRVSMVLETAHLCDCQISPGADGKECPSALGSGVLCGVPRPLPQTIIPPKLWFTSLIIIIG